jgi:hypothetical protein
VHRALPRDPRRRSRADDPELSGASGRNEEARRRELGELARRLARENDEARRLELGKLAPRLAEECWREQGLPKVIRQLAMTLANALDPECDADLP